MPINITMPALSPTMEEGNLAKWLVKEGDAIASGDVIAEIETDKATMEVESIDDGIMGRILVPEGSEGVKVNAVIAILLQDGDPADSGPAASAPVASPDPEPAAASVTEPANGQADAVNATPLAKRVAGQQNVDLAAITGSGARNRIVVADVTKAAEPGYRAAISSGGPRLFASPLARRTAKDAGLDLTLIIGSGPNGRIIQNDVQQAIAAGTAKPAIADAPVTPSAKTMPPVSGMADDAVLKLYTEGDFELKKHDTMRRIIAERLSESSQTIPVYFLTLDCEIDQLLALRSQMNAAAPIGDDEKPQYKISVNDFIVKAMALALQQVPMANASWLSHSRMLHKHSDVGVAVAIPDGLLTPIVRQAEQKSLSTISAEVKDMAGRARIKKLMPHEYQGGSTAVSNLGMFGVKEFTSIINPPHASIVSIGAGSPRAVVKDGALAIATVMSASFAFDHRVIDGALGAELAGSFKHYIENPAAMLA